MPFHPTPPLTNPPPGVLLCHLAARLEPDCGIDSQHLKTGNLAAKRSNISLFLKVSLLLQHLPASCVPARLRPVTGCPSTSSSSRMTWLS